VNRFQINVNQLLMRQISNAELIVNPDGTIYHLNVHPEQVAPTIITVGDPDRVKMVSQYFDRMEFQVHKREFVTHTGYIGAKRLTVLSTGIGTDNIDIVFNELDALFNIDLNTKKVKSVVTPLQFIRLGTSGCLVEDIPNDTILVSRYAIGLDSLLHYYPLPQSEKVAALQQLINQQFLLSKSLPISPYVTEGSSELIAHLGKGLQQGITLTATGFYAPQGRQLRIKNKQADLLSFFQGLDISPITPLPISNLEMETAGIYGLAKAMGHEAISFNALLANRVTGAFSAQPMKTVQGMIELVINRLSNNMPMG